MKIARSSNTDPAYQSDFDWQGYLQSFDWRGFFFGPEGLQPSEENRLREDCFPIEADGYRLVQLDIPIRRSEMEEITRQCGNSFARHPTHNSILRLQDNMLFVLDESAAYYTRAIVRFEADGDAFKAVEYVEDMQHLNGDILSPLASGGWLIQAIDGLLLTRHAYWLDEDDWNKGWAWREKGEPEPEKARYWVMRCGIHDG